MTPGKNSFTVVIDGLPLMLATGKSDAKKSRLSLSLTRSPSGPSAPLWHATGDPGGRGDARLPT